MERIVKIKRITDYLVVFSSFSIVKEKENDS